LQNPSLKWFACALVAVFGFLAGALVLYVSMSKVQGTGGSTARIGESSERYEKLHAKYVYLKRRNEMLHEKLQDQRRAFLAFEKELLTLRKESRKRRWRLFEVEATPCLGIPVLVSERAKRSGPCAKRPKASQHSKSGCSDTGERVANGPTPRAKTCAGTTVSNITKRGP
jgi:hypothetical protein